jgi:hypothetical protein
MNKLICERRYIVGGRYGYSAVDEVQAGICLRTIATQLTRKNASALADACDNAYHDGWMDAQVGLTLPLLKDQQKRECLNEIDAPAGTIVKVLKRSGGLFDVETNAGKRLTVGIDALRERET